MLAPIVSSSSRHVVTGKTRSQNSESFSSHWGLVTKNSTWGLRMASWNSKPPFQQFMLQGFSDHSMWIGEIFGSSVGTSVPARFAMACAIMSATCGLPGYVNFLNCSSVST